MSSYRCTCGIVYATSTYSECPRCGVALPRITATARLIECPTMYVEYRGWSQEVDTLHVETVADNDENKRFSASFKHTPLDTKPTTVYGHSPSDVLGKVRAEIESAKWDVHYRQAIDRIDALTKQVEKLTAQLQLSASPAAAPLPPATSPAQP